MTFVRAALERIFAALERAFTALVYPWCLLRERAGCAVRVPILMYHQVGPALDSVTGGSTGSSGALRDADAGDRGRRLSRHKARGAGRRDQGRQDPRASPAASS